MNVVTNNVNIKWQPDTGTDKDLMDKGHLIELEKKIGKQISLKHTKLKMYPYGSKVPLNLLGCFKANLQAGNEKTATTIYVTEERSPFPLLSESSAEKLKLVVYNKDHIVNQVAIKKDNGKQNVLDDCQNDSMRKEVSSILKENSSVFADRIGKCTMEPVSIMIDESIPPVVQKCRPIPINLHSKAAEKIDELLRNDIIEPVPDNEARTWVRPPVIGKKPNSDEIRLCVDMRLANNAIKIPCVQLPTIAEIADKFEGCVRYSKIDLREAYHQFVLDEKSRGITTFYGPDNLYRYKRLNYGTKSAQDIMQIEIQKILEGIPNQANQSDDVLIGGKTVPEHDKALQAVLQRLREHGLTVRLKKTVMDVEEIEFSGMLFRMDGISPSEKNVKNLKEARAPTNKSELRSFLGMATYSEKFIPNFASIVAPLRQLVKAKRWAWKEEHENSFEMTKNLLSESAR